MDAGKGVWRRMLGDPYPRTTLASQNCWYWLCRALTRPQNHHLIRFPANLLEPRGHLNHSSFTCALPYFTIHLVSPADSEVWHVSPDFLWWRQQRMTDCSDADVVCRFWTAYLYTPTNPPPSTQCGLCWYCPSPANFFKFYFIKRLQFPFLCAELIIL